MSESRDKGAEDGVYEPGGHKWYAGGKEPKQFVFNGGDVSPFGHEDEPEEHKGDIARQEKADGHL